MARRFPRSATAETLIAHRRLYKTDDPRTFTVIGRDGTRRYRIVELADGESACECQAGLTVEPCWHRALFALRRYGGVMPRTTRAAPKPGATAPAPTPETYEPTATTEAPTSAAPKAVSPDGTLGWDGSVWRPLTDWTEAVEPDAAAASLATTYPEAVREEDVEHSSEVAEVEPDSIPPNELPTAAEEQPAKRPRGRPRKTAPEPVELDPDAPFRPNIKLITAKAERVVSTGSYESFKIASEVVAEPDPHHTVVDNVANLNALVKQEVNEVAEAVAREIQLGKA